MSTTTTTAKPAIDILADLPVGAEFAANGKVYEMADGFELYPAAGKAVFNVYDRNGALRRLQVKATQDRNTTAATVKRT